jgi:hypothetical protein
MKLRWHFVSPDLGRRFLRDPQPDFRTARVLRTETVWSAGEGEVVYLRVQCPAGCGEHRVLPGQYVCGNVRWKVSV